MYDKRWYFLSVTVWVDLISAKRKYRDQMTNCKLNYGKKFILWIDIIILLCYASNQYEETLSFSCKYIIDWVNSSNLTAVYSCHSHFAESGQADEFELRKSGSSPKATFHESDLLLFAEYPWTATKFYKLIFCSRWEPWLRFYNQC